MIMRCIAGIAAIAVLASPAAFAQTQSGQTQSGQTQAGQTQSGQTQSGMFALTGRGDSGWRISCEVERLGRAPRRIEAEGRGHNDREVLVAGRATGGRCTYAAPSDGELVMEFEDDHFACPLEDAEGLCRTTIAAGRSGEIALRLRG